MQNSRSVYVEYKPLQNSLLVKVEGKYHTSSIKKGSINYLCRGGKVIGFGFSKPEKALNFKRFPLELRYTLLVLMWQAKQAAQNLQLKGHHKNWVDKRIYTDDHFKRVKEHSLNDLAELQEMFPGIPLHLIFKPLKGE